MRAIVFAVLFPVMILLSSCSQMPIDRYSLVTRHNVTITDPDSLNSLSVGNGEFAFTVDFTGLQTFPEKYEKGVPLGTMSNWGWHTDPNPQKYSLSDVYRTYKVHGRQIGYVHQYRKGDEERKYLASEWLRANPRRIHLGIIGLQITREDGSEIKPDDIKDPVQTLNLWTGEIRSRFIVDGKTVVVRTVCHPDYDLVSSKVSSELISEGRLKVRLRFPYGSAISFGSDLDAEGRHTTTLQYDSAGVALFTREQNADHYNVLVRRSNSEIKESGKHMFIIEPAADSVFSFSCHFFSQNAGRSCGFDETEKASAESWNEFWNTGGAVDFSECTDPRAFELERRVILSRYLTRIQSSGSMPPAETGLTYNSWFGKFHLEMHWWHSAHFALWQKSGILTKQMQYYTDIFENARKTAGFQGYKGVRWPKMVGPDGRESPSTVGTYLIWQQPHVIFFAEQLYQDAGNKAEILNKYKDIVFSTADFMASYEWFDKDRDKYILGPVLIPAQESLNLESTVNPAFETVYWYWALNKAQEWRKRLGLKGDPLWQDIVEKISPLPVEDGVYLCSEDTRDSYKNPRYMSDHPIVAGVLGVMPETPLVDRKILMNSLDTIKKVWNWKSTWGWDFPMLAMSAAAVGRGEDAVSFLLMDAQKNRYLANGHNYQDARLSIYLPGNGGLLTAVAKMCVNDQFPHNGKWKVRWENLNKYPD